MKKLLTSALLLAFLVVAACAHSQKLPVMKVDYVMTHTYVKENTVICDPLRLELGANMGKAKWGHGFAAFETKWNGPLTFEIIGSENYQSYDSTSIAAISLDYGVGDGYSVRHHFGIGTILESRGQHGPGWGNASANCVMHGNLLTADANVQRVTIDTKKYAPKGWNGKLWIGLILHNAGEEQYAIVRIVNARPDSDLPSRPIFDSLKNLLAGSSGPSADELAFHSQRYDREQKKMPAELASYIGLFSKNEAKNAIDGIEDADDSLSLKHSTVFSQFVQDANSAQQKSRDANNLLSSWKKAGSFGSEIGCIMRLASNLVKVGVQDLSVGEVVGKNPKGVKLTAARNEHEGFQLVLTPFENSMKRISVSASPLQGKSFTIPQSNLRVHAVAYTRVFEGRVNQLYQPDPFLPEGQMPTLQPGVNHSYWISVKVPDNAPAGIYKGKVTVSAMNASYEIPLTLQVRNFNIPKQISLRSSFWMFRDQINRFYNLDEVKIEDYMKWIDMALEYRLNPIDVYEGQCIQYLDIVKTDPQTGARVVNENPDWSKWDTYIDHMVRGGANTIHLGVSHHQGAYFPDKENPIASPGQIEQVKKSLEIARKHYKEKGIYDMHYMQLRDETSAPDALNVYRAIYRDMPDVKVLLTAPSDEARDCLRIPCPLTPSYNREWRDEVVENGGEYWWYVCVGPSHRRYSNLFIDQMAVQHRAWWWQTWHYDVQGLLYWGLNYYKWYRDPLLSTMKTVSTVLPDLDYIEFSPIEHAPGDGFSIYPGPTPDQPIPSLRLETMRDGEEDFEYLIMLEKLIEQNPNTRQAAKGKKVLEKAHSLTRTLTNYELDESVYQKVRNEIADSIEALIAK